MLQRQSYAPYALYGHHGRSVTSNDWLKRYLSNSATRILSAQHVSAAILLFPLVADRAGLKGKLPVELCVATPAFGTILREMGFSHKATPENFYYRRATFGDPLRRAFWISSIPLLVKRSFSIRSSRVPVLSSLSIIFPVTSFPHFQGMSSDPKALRSPIFMSERTLLLPFPLASTSSS